MIANLRKFSKTIAAKVLMVIVVIPFIFWGMGGVFSSGNTNSLAKINKYNIALLKSNIPEVDPKAVYRQRVDDPLSAPERSSPYTIPTASINIPTRGESSGYQQVGILIEENGTGNNQVKLPLYGQQLYPRSKEWNYYTNSDGYQSIKLSLKYNGRDSMDTYGCSELYNNNIVEVDGYDSKFKATIYKLDAPRYIPNIL